MSGHVTQLCGQKQWLVTSYVDEMPGGSRTLAVYQQWSWLSSMLSCKAVLLFIDAQAPKPKPSSLLRSPSFCFYFSLFLLTSDDVLYVLGHFGLVVGKSEDQMGEWKLGILRLGNTLAIKI